MNDTPDPSASSAPRVPPAPAAPPIPPLSYNPPPPAYLADAPAPPPLPTQYQSVDEQQVPRRRARKTLGVVFAVLIVGVKLAIAFGAGHLLSGSSGPVIAVVVGLLVVFGFLTRFMRL